MKTLSRSIFLVIVAFVLGALTQAAIAQVKQAPAVYARDPLETGPIYLYDARGRCLRVQLQIVNEKVVVASVPTEICAK